MDDDLRRALQPLAEGPLPDGMLDPRLDPRSGRVILAGLAAGVVGLAIAMALAAQDRPIAADASPTPTASSTRASPSAAATPSDRPQPSAGIGVLPEGVVGDWQFVDGTVDGRSLVIPDVTRVTLTIEPDRMLGEAPCNAYGGSIRADGSGVQIVVSEMTEVGCLGVAEAERSYLGALGRVTSARADESVLQLTAPGVRLRFARVVEMGLGSGGEWRFTSGVVDGGVLSMPDRHVVTLIVGPSSIGGQAPCNTYRAGATRDGARFEVGQITQTEIGCDDLEDLERTYLEALGRITTAEAGPNGLWLTGPDVALRFVRLFGYDGWPDGARPLVLPEIVAYRAALPSCGHETVDRQPEGDFLDPEVRACFLAAQAAGEAAEMITDGRTPEGGVHRDILRLLPSGGIEVYADSTRDPLATPQWMLMGCRAIRLLGTDPAGVPSFIADDCDEGQVIIGTDTEVAPTGNELAMLERLIGFARDPDAGRLDGVPFDEGGVWLGLGDELVVRRTPVELTEAAAWALDVQAFRGRIGQFTALDHLADWDYAAAGPHAVVGELSAVIGDHAQCSASSIGAPDAMASLRRLSVQPLRPASCLSWWSVDLFLNADGAIEAITLDLWEP